MGPVTQEDPIGIAGGLNLYGYANGDPINFSDPFGLCPPEDDNTEDCPDDVDTEADTEGGDEADGEGRYQQFANWGAQEGGFFGWLALNTGATLEAVTGIADVLTPTTCENGVCYGTPPAATTQGAFTRGGFLNSNRYLRVGVGKHGSYKWFRLSGQLIERFRESGHVNILRLGRWGS